MDHFHIIHTLPTESDYSNPQNFAYEYQSGSTIHRNIHKKVPRSNLIMPTSLEGKVNKLYQNSINYIRIPAYMRYYTPTYVENP